ncbi:MAG: MaoC family dehydratase [Acidimicrobiales bacterium]|nr:MaoC family dehydratase [Acidimicrobiales bacterium]
MTVVPASCSRQAVADPPEVSAANPVHDESATGYGYAGGIVAGIHTYGWMVPAILDSLGERWLSHGWSEFRLPRPVYAQDELLTEVHPSPDDPSIGLITQTVVSDGRVTIEGKVGLGDAPWRNDFHLPEQRSPVPEADHRPFLGLDEIPSALDSPAMSVSFDAGDARTWMTERIHDDDPLWITGDAPAAHPSWVLGQMTPLIRHSYRMPAGVHASGRVQHLSPFKASGPVTVAGRWGEVAHRKGKPWSTSDAVFIDSEGTEVALVRQVAVILPPLPRD